MVSSPGPVAPPPTEVATGGLDAPRVLGRAQGGKPGPTLIVVGGLHGNEPAGVLALQRILEALAADSRGLEQGRLVGLAGNRKALSRKRRYLTHDLNRYWDLERVQRLRRTSGPLEDEDEELRDLDHEIERARREADDGRVYLLDIHSTSGRELPFATLDDTLANRKLAVAFPVPVVLGLEEELADTLTTYVSICGIVTSGFEAGQHDDPASVDRAAAAIWIALEVCGLLASDQREEVGKARRLLAQGMDSVPPVVEVRYRHPVAPGDWFRMDPGWLNLQPVRRGQTVAVDRNGPIASPMDGLILMPLYQRQGAEGFFVVQRVASFWLHLSTVLRRLHLERFLHLLPGVERDPKLPGAFIVNRKTARWLARELFHLLGFRRLGAPGKRFLRMARRGHD